MLERRAVQPQLGLLKSTMLQLDSAFTEKAYGANSFSDFVEKLKKADYVNVSGQGGRYIIERKTSTQPERPTPEAGRSSSAVARRSGNASPRNGERRHRRRPGCAGFKPRFLLPTWPTYGFQEFSEFLNYAQDKLVVRVVPDEEKGLMVYLGAEFYPPAVPEAPAEQHTPKKRKRTRSSPSWKASPRCWSLILRLLSRSPSGDRVKLVESGNSADRPPRRSRKKKPEHHHGPMQ